MRRTRLIPAIASAALLSLALAVPIAWAGESEHDHAHEHGTATASAKQAEKHQHDENCDHGGSPWERGSVMGTLRSDANALIAVWVGIGAYALLIRRQGRTVVEKQEAAQ
jgi:hypothetical protein